MRLALLAVLLVGCSEKKEDPATFACASRIECPNQRVPASLDQCNDAAFDEACGAAYRSYFECFSKNHVCDGRGQFDEDASAARCGEQLNAWHRCVGPDSGAPMDSTIDDTFVEPDTAEQDTATEDTTVDDATTAD